MNTLANQSANKASAADNNIKIFRYKLSEDIMKLITRFAKMHQYDDRHTYKEAWQSWTNTQQDYIAREIERLTQLGFKGDIMDNMFKAGRYYFREKTNEEEEEEEEEEDEPNADKNNDKTKEVKERKKETKEKITRDYIVMDQTIIQAMDKHLNIIMKQANFKPATGYVEFCEQEMQLLRPEIIRLSKYSINAEKLAEKIKKTYKNRYFILAKTK